MNEIKVRLSHWLLIIGIFIVPYYPFESGSLQPSHVILFLFSFLVILKEGVPNWNWSVSLFFISLYSFLVEAVCGIFFENPVYVVNSLFFLFNFLICCSTFYYFRRNGIALIAPGLFGACLIAIGGIAANGVSADFADEVGRQTSTFNNPNQLGYFSVCVLSLGYLLLRHGKINYIAAFFFFFTALYLSVVSLSKAAILANVLVILVVSKPLGNFKLSVLWYFVSSLVVLYLAYIFFSGGFDDYVFVKRIANIADEEDSSLTSRGYFAFLDASTFQFFFGMGAGRVRELVGHEVHSTFASVLNNYGIVGFLFFSAPIILWVHRLWRFYGFVGMYSIAAPSMLYGITHNGTRFTIFWILFSASLAMTYKKNE